MMVLNGGRIKNRWKKSSWKRDQNSLHFSYPSSTYFFQLTFSFLSIQDCEKKEEVSEKQKGCRDEQVLSKNDEVAELQKENE